MKKRIILSIGILIFFVLIITPTSILSAQESVDISLRRTFGMAFGKNIQGTFTVVGTGSENIVNLSLHFDGNELAFTESNSLTYQFNTKDYEPGELNMTLIGYDNEDVFYSSTKIVKILSPTVTILISTAIILFVLTAAFMKYGPRIKNYFRTKKNNRRKNDPSIDGT